MDEDESRQEERSPTQDDTSQVPAKSLKKIGLHGSRDAKKNAGGTSKTDGDELLDVSLMN